VTRNFILPTLLSLHDIIRPNLGLGKEIIGQLTPVPKVGDVEEKRALKERYATV
jgi:hypothetical protein